MRHIELLGSQSRSGYSEALAEGVFLANLHWTTAASSSLKQSIDPFIVMPAASPMRYLTQSEQRVLKRALLRSTRLISAG